MTLTPTAAQSLEIIASVGDFGNNFLATNLPDVWAKYDSIGGRLQFLYTKRDIIDMAMGEVRKSVTALTPQDVSMYLSDMLKGLLAMKKAVLADIDKELVNPGGVVDAVGGLVAFAGELLTTGSTDLMGPRGYPDANDMIYRGSPYRFPPRRRLP